MIRFDNEHTRFIEKWDCDGQIFYTGFDVRYDSVMRVGKLGVRRVLEGKVSGRWLINEGRGINDKEKEM